MIFFRADANERIGIGHVMRCLSIAAVAGEEVLFITADEEAGQQIRQAAQQFSDLMGEEAKASQELPGPKDGKEPQASQEPRFRHHVLQTRFDHMDVETEKMVELIRRYRPGMVFVDSYFVSPGYLYSLRDACHEVGGRLIYVDDRAEFAYPCDVLVNYNIYGPDIKEIYESLYDTEIAGEAKITEGKAGEEVYSKDRPVFLLGPGYAPLRGEFQNLSDRRIKEIAEDILISTGGSDPEHIALQLARQICAHPVQERFHLVVGAMNPDKEELRLMAVAENHIVIHENEKNMAELMRHSDVAVSAAGSTLYELCATRTPTITYILAENQIQGAKGFERHGVMRCAGDLRRDGEAIASHLLKAALELAENYEARKAMAERMGQVVDGQGASRLIKKINSLQ